MIKAHRGTVPILTVSNTPCLFKTHRNVLWGSAAHHCNIDRKSIFMYDLVRVFNALTMQMPSISYHIWAKLNWLALKIFSMITDLPYDTEALDCSSVLSYWNYDATLEPTANLFIQVLPIYCNLSFFTIF